MALILAGGGDATQSAAADKRFCSLLGGKPLLYLPLAMAKARHPSCEQWIRQTLAPYGITDIVMWSDVRGKRYEDLLAFGGIYIGGGNTYSLLHQLREADFNALLKRFVREGHHVYGGSAGAIIFGASIGAADDPNDVALADLSGLEMAGRWSIYCHYKGERRAQDLGMELIALPETAAIIVEGDRFTVIGDTVLRIAEECEELAPGSAHEF